MRQCSIESREIIYVDKPDARKPLDFNLLRISPESLIDQNKLLPFHFSTVVQYLMTWFLIAVRQEVKRIDNSVVHAREISNKTRFIGPFMKCR